jgi:hypothetical protein
LSSQASPASAVASIAPIIQISSSSPSPDSNPKPYENDSDFQEVYDVDKILAESIRPVTAEHASMSQVPIRSPCTHYLVKWAGYPTSLSTWTPVSLCSKALIDLYLQEQSRTSCRPLSDASSGPLSDANPSAISLPLVIVEPTIPTAAVPLSGAPQTSNQVAESVSAMLGVSTVEELKARVAQNNLGCNVRIRGRDRRIAQNGEYHDTVRVACKHVQGAIPCSLTITCDVVEGLVSNIRRYVPGSCMSNICDCCSCLLADELNIYDGCHRFCKNCVSVTVISEVQGEDLPLFIQSRQIRCGYCKKPLIMDMVSRLMNQDAMVAYQNALCTIASLESEKITETRLRATCTKLSPSMSPKDSHSIILHEVESLILPFCPICKRAIPDFDGCCALQCGHLGGAFNKELGCGAHICAWCQNDFVDAFTCHQHVAKCIHNPTGAFDSPPNDHLRYT